MLKKETNKKCLEDGCSSMLYLEVGESLQKKGKRLGATRVGVPADRQGRGNRGVVGEAKEGICMCTIAY